MESYNLDMIIRDALIKALTHCKGSRMRTARAMGISVRSVRIWMHKYKLHSRFPVKVWPTVKQKKENAAKGKL